MTNGVYGSHVFFGENADIKAQIPKSDIVEYLSMVTAPSYFCKTYPKTSRDGTVQTAFASVFDPINDLNILLILPSPLYPK